MAMRTLESDMLRNVSKHVHIIGPSDIDLFMESFEEANTLPDKWEEWEGFLIRNRVEEHLLHGEGMMLLVFMSTSPHLKDPFNRADLLSFKYDNNCNIHGGEDAYITFVSLL